MNFAATIVVVVGISIADIWLLRRKSWFLAAFLTAILLAMAIAALPMAD